MVEMVDNSILSSVALCDTQAIMSYHFGYRTPGGKVKANIGKAIHEAHAVWFSSWDQASAMSTFDAAYDRLVSAEEVAAMEPNDPCIKANVQEILATYYSIRPKSFFPFDPIVEGIEQVHKMPLMEGVEFFGLVDLPVRERATGALMVCDHKNRFGYINDWYTKDFRLKSQFTGYVWVLQRLYDEVVSGVYVNALAVQKLPNNTTTRCRVHKVPYNQCRLEHVDAKLFVVSRPHYLLESWERLAKKYAQRWLELKKMVSGVEMVKYLEDNGTFTGGCTFCEFKKFCASGRSENSVGKFTVEHWRPWEGLR